MADVKLVLEFRDTTATKYKWVFNNASSTVTDKAVKALVKAMIDNGSIYKNPPVTAVSAYLVTTTSESLNITGVN